MARSETPKCPHCDFPMRLALPPGGNSPRIYVCLECAEEDPMKLPSSSGWVNGELKPPR
jgi:hypothetical protein